MELKNALITDETGKTFKLALFLDKDEKYRWYEITGDGRVDTEVSGKTIVDAIASARIAWAGPWSFRLV